MTTKTEVEAKREVRRKQCSKCGRTRTFSPRMNEPLEYIPRILWQEYGGMVICTKCFVGIRAA